MQFQGRELTLVDTPGFDDTNRSEAEILREIALWLTNTYSANIRVSGLIYMHRITDHRFTGAAGRLLKMFKELVGSTNFSSIIFVTSCWDLLDSVERGVQREKELVNTAWSHMVGRGAQVSRFDGTQERSLDALRLLPLVGGVVTLTIQEEMVEQHKSLKDTAAGRALHDEMVESELRHQRETEELLREIEQLKNQGKAPLGPLESGKSEAEGVFELQLELEALREQLKRVQLQERRKTKVEVEEEDFSFKRPAGWSSTPFESSTRQQGSNTQKGGFKPMKGAYYGKEERSSTDERGDDTKRRDDAKTFNLYRELADDEIRLVNLHAGDGSLPMEIELNIEKYGARPDYEAVSYVVGPPDASAIIMVRRGKRIRPIPISKTLDAVLRILREPFEDRLLWVDALSIDQDNPDERSAQISKMSRIFREARHVRIWIGPSADIEGSDSAMELIPQILDFSVLDSLVHNESMRNHWRALAKLMGRDWFRRRWVVQEMAFARKATVHCGSKSVPWPDFADAAALFGSKWFEFRQGLKAREVYELGEVQGVGASSLVDISSNVFRKDQTGAVLTRLFSLESLLATLPMFEVTQDHDCVYAIIDLGQDSAGVDSIVRDYTVPAADLFRNVVEFVVDRSGSLDIICSPWARVIRPKLLPLWISTVSVYAYIRRPNGQYTRHNADSLVGMPDHRHYKASGSTVSHGNVAFGKAGGRAFLRVTGHKVGGISSLADRCVNGNIPGEWMTLGGWTDRESQPIPHDLWRTLVADRTAIGRKPPNWYGKACEFGFRQNAMHDIDIPALISIQSSHVAECLQRVQAMTWNRRLFILASQDAPGRLGLAPPKAQDGDLICILSGCSVPVALRKVGTQCCLIGECFVMDLMDGEALGERSAQDVMNETFEIL